MKIDFKYDYVPEGQSEPDEHGRWSVTGYVYAHVDKSLTEYWWTQEKYVAVPVCVIKKHNSPDHKYITKLCSMSDPCNIGLSEANFFSNDLEDLKQQV